MRKITNRYFS